MKWNEIRHSYSDRLQELRDKLDADPYSVLGVSHDSSDKEVKIAYRKLVSAYHPDRQDAFLQAHSQEVMKIVNEAYEQICRNRGI
jgi:DnaJ-class molecular chaperone